MSKDNIIPFVSDITDIQKNKNTNPIVSTNSNATNMIINEWKYTCPNCGENQVFHTENCIFRTAEFFCSSCGSPHRITNPAFSRN